MSTFYLKSYHIPTKKVRKPLRLHFISDLHGVADQKRQKELLEKMKERRPDLILVGGDTMVSGEPDTWGEALAFLKILAKEYPICLAYGNHEQRLTKKWKEQKGQAQTREEREFLRELAECGILLDNESREISVRGESLVIHGLSLDRSYFRKPFPRRLSVGKIRELLGRPGERGKYHILLAHSPYHGDAYFEWGCDLTLSGHYHGGVWRFGKCHGLVSTYFHPVPRYCCGCFLRGERRLIVSAGLGEHTVKFRIHNPRELVEIRLCPIK